MSEAAPNTGGQSVSRQTFEKDVVFRACADPAFRHQLLADPRAAIQAAYGLELPPDIEIHVLEETPSRFYLVLPAVSEELTDEQLAGVAGGTGMQGALATTGSVTALDDLIADRMSAAALRMR